MSNNRSVRTNHPNNTDSEKIVAGPRTYAIEIKTNRAGRQYLLITEVCSDGTSDVLNSLVVFQQHLGTFHKFYLKAAQQLEPKLKPFDLATIRERYPRAYEPWTPEEDEELAELYSQGMARRELAMQFERQPGAISSRVRKLGLAPA